MIPAPLRDLSGGQLRAWPGGGAIRYGGLYEPCFRPAVGEERAVATVLPTRDRRAVYCKYCYQDVLPLILREEVIPGRVTEMTLCAECGYGLTPSEEVTV